MKKKTFKLWPLLALLAACLLMLSALSSIAGTKNVHALGIKCQRLDGTMDDLCLNKAGSRTVTMTYASGTYRRSRAGSNYRNYINRELTESKRSATKESNRFKRTYTRVGTAKLTIRETILRQLQLRRQARAKAQEAKFE